MYNTHIDKRNLNNDDIAGSKPKVYGNIILTEVAGVSNGPPTTKNQSSVFSHLNEIHGRDRLKKDY
jgi:hypothetical protein